MNSTDNTHVIMRQILELDTTANPGDYQELTEQLSRLGGQCIPDLINHLLDRLDIPGQVIQLDQIIVELECDISISLEALLEAELVPTLNKALKEAMDTPNATLISAAYSDVEAWLFFLKNGYLPWNVSRSFQLSEQEYRISEALVKEPELAKKIAYKLHDPLSLKRLLNQFSPQMPWRIAEALFAGFEEKHKFAWSGVADRSQLLERKLFWQAIFASPLSSLSNVDKILKEVSIVDTLSEFQLPDTPSQILQDTGVFIQNAGLVLMHPFINLLFTELGIVQEGQILDHHKAMLTLHYATSGEKEAPEWALAFPKLLCGVPLNQVIASSINFQTTEIQEIEKMLASIIHHWAILKNSSIEGLREAFLQREGHLTETHDHWILKVEQKSYDLLLEHLPWGIGMIKLPWMTKPLYTEWYG